MMHFRHIAVCGLLITAVWSSAPAAEPPGPTPVTSGLIPVSAADILLLAREQQGGMVLLNIWATWCNPCREELPALLKLREKYLDRGLKLVLVSADFTSRSEEAANYLAGLGVDFPSYIKDQKDDEFINQINPDWSGALPYTVLFGRDGGVVKIWDGKLEFSEANELLSERL